MTLGIVLSPSAVNMYVNCPYSFKLKYIDRLKPYIADDTALKLGSSVHKVLQYFYDYVHYLTLTNPETEFVEAIKKSAKDHWDRSINAKKRDEMNTYMMLWLKFEVQRYKRYKELGIIERFPPVKTEEDITDWNRKIRAIIDKRCVGISGKQYALDYKTDRRLPAQRNFKGDLKQIDLKYKVQSAMNAMVLESQDEHIDNFYFQFIRYPDKLLSVPLTDELFDEINSLISKIRNTEEFEKNYKSCFTCFMKIHCKTKDSCSHCITNDVI